MSGKQVGKQAHRRERVIWDRQIRGLGVRNTADRHPELHSANTDRGPVGQADDRPGG